MKSLVIGQKSRQRLLMDRGWRFHLGDIPPIVENTHYSVYLSSKAGEALGGAKYNFDDNSWREVDLPHDWQIEMHFDKAEIHSHGSKARGIAWYRKTFRLSEEDRNKTLFLEFGAVTSYCTVWINGHKMHHNWCGYTSFTIDFTAIAQFGDHLNSVVVRVDATVHESWSYEGAGINRHVWLIKTHPVYVAPWGIWINPVKNGENWNTEIEATIENSLTETQEFFICSKLISPQGAFILQVETNCSIEALDSKKVQYNIIIKNPELWSIETPNLYTMETSLIIGNTVIDSITTTFGYRTLRFDANKGFFLNDKQIKIKGTCNHQDHAGLGSALPDSIHEFRIRTLKSFGCNAYRCAHHPPAPELLDACDRHGILVMNENRNFGSSSEHLSQLQNMIIRDRNHPSIFLWSISNEEMIEFGEPGKRIAIKMINEIKKLDPSRPVTAAINGVDVEHKGIATYLDVIGLNYHHNSYEELHNSYPDKPLISSENNCTYSTRGEYITDVEKMYFTSYDENCTPFGTTARNSWKIINSLDYISGTFIWTGFDYRGEPYPYKWPCVQSNLAIVDSCGFPKDSYYLHKALWTSEPVLHLLPHWNWEGREGQLIKVVAYTNCHIVELFLNGKSLGQKEVDAYEQVSWIVEYKPGCIYAKGFMEDNLIVEDKIETTGKPVALQLDPDRWYISEDSEDAVPIKVYAVDELGRFVPYANNEIRFSIKGAGRIIGVGNGDPTCHEEDKGSERSLFNGLCQVIIQSNPNPTMSIRDTIEVCAQCEGLASATISLECNGKGPRPFVPSEKFSFILSKWYRSPIYHAKPDSYTQLLDNDVNSWDVVEITEGSESIFKQTPGYAVYQTKISSLIKNREYNLIFEGILGSAEIYINGKLSLIKKATEVQSVQVKISKSNLENIVVRVFLDGSSGEAGIVKKVRLV